MSPTLAPTPRATRLPARIRRFVGPHPATCGPSVEEAVEEAVLPAAVVFLILGSSLFSLLYIWFACPFDLSPDEAHYWDWSRRLDWSYYSKGPLVAWLIRTSCELLGPLSLNLTGELTAAVRTPAVLCHAVLLAGWYVLAVSVFRSPQLGLWVLACAAILPVVRAGAVFMTIDPPFLAAWCWALVCVVKGVERGQWQWWAGAAACTAAGVLAKYTMVLLPAAVLTYLAVHRREEFRRPGVWLLLAGAVAGSLPIVIWNARHEWVSLWHVWGQVGGSAKPSWRWLGPLAFVGGQFGMLFAGWLVVAGAAAVRFRPDRHPDPGVRLLWWASVPVWGLFLLASFVKPGQANWPAPAYVGGFVLAVAWLRNTLARSRSVRLGFALTVAGGLIATGWGHFPDLVRPVLARLAGPPTPEHPLPVRKLDPTARLSGWQELAAVVDQVRGRVRDQTGQEPVVVGTHWTFPGTLRFHCQGHPDTYSIGVANGSDRFSQYDLWRPNPLRDAQDFLGRSFVIVGDIGEDVARAFERIELPRRFFHVSNGVPIAGWAIWVGHGFRGFDTVPLRTAGRY